ncbi:hypothetical protein [Baekduia sp.]|jgi:hypothetical protein|uniref:hypothetical protein n=1 Tax=Baekduia sp. TaxID=2600305 RepID=UPI002E0602AE|nr:hypothetical protein [Baekduia sp.]
MNVRALAAALTVGALAAAGCGADTEGPAAPAAVHQAGTPANAQQLLVLAHVLEANRQHGGARFTARLDVHDGHAVATGRVDFHSGRGTALLRPVSASGGAPRRFYWTRHAVLTQTTPGGARYARQAPDPQGDPVHAMIGFINLLAAETIDNTTNIRDQDARLLRHTTIDGASTDEYNYGPRASTTLWVQRADGLLRRVRTDRVPGGLTVDLTTHEPIRITLPARRDG